MCLWTYLFFMNELLVIMIFWLWKLIFKLRNNQMSKNNLVKYRLPIFIF